MVLQFGSASSPTCKRPGRDPRRWLEDVEGAAQLDWVKAKNAEAISILGDPKASPVYDRILSILDSKQKIPFVGRVLNGKYYNFWQVRELFFPTAFDAAISRADMSSRSPPGRDARARHLAPLLARGVSQGDHRVGDRARPRRALQAGGGDTRGLSLRSSLLAFLAAHPSLLSSRLTPPLLHR